MNDCNNFILFSTLKIKITAVSTSIHKTPFLFLVIRDIKMKILSEQLSAVHGGVYIPFKEVKVGRERVG